MAITVVATTTAVVEPGGGSDDVTIPGTPLENDIVEVVVAADTGVVEEDILTSGYTTIAENSGTNIPSLVVAYKRMGSSPDSTVEIAQGGGSLDYAVTVRLLRGIDTTTALDVTPTEDIGSGSFPDAPSITTSTDGAMVTAYGLLDDDDVASSVTVPSGYSNLLTADTGNGNTNASGATIMIADKVVSSAGPEDPPIFGGGGADQWTGVTVAWRPSSGSTVTAAGTAAGTGAASAASVAYHYTDGIAAGAGAASGAVEASAETAGAAAGSGEASGDATAAAVTTGTAAGTGTASGVGLETTIEPGAGTAAGTGTATAVGAATGAGAGSAAGSGAAMGVSDSEFTAETAGTAAGAGTAAAVSASRAEATGSAAGTGSASAAGLLRKLGVGTADGVGTATGVASVIYFAVGRAAGQGRANGATPRDAVRRDKLRPPSPIERIVEADGKGTQVFLALMRDMADREAKTQSNYNALVAKLVDEGSLPGGWEP